MPQTHEPSSLLYCLFSFTALITLQCAGLFINFIVCYLPLLIEVEASERPEFLFDLIINVSQETKEYLIHCVLNKN